MLSGGSDHGSSRIPPSKLMCSRFRSLEYGFAAVTGVGMPCFFAYAMRSVRDLKSHSLQGAMTRTPGIRA